MTDYRVPRYDYPAQFADLDGDLLPRIRELLTSGNYILGDPLSALERSLAEYLDVPHVVGVNSGTDALVLALDALGVGPDDEVITVANTFHATALAILRVGARPVLVDCRPDNYLIDLEQAENAVTQRTKALIVVHMFGQAVDMTAAADLADRYGLALVEDCAQAIGARFDGQPVGSTSNAGCWSFAPSKNLAAAGDAGAVSVRDQELADKLRLLRHFGQTSQNYHEVVAYNSRLDSIQALVLSHKLPLLEDWNRRRREIASDYRAKLSGLPVSFQEGAAPDEHVYHLFQLRTRRRDELAESLQAAGIDAVVRYPIPLHLQGAFRSLGHEVGAFPVSEALSRETLCLPLHPALNADQVGYVTEAVHAFFAESP
ncbi:DegT/DnrJ/EryC1/StrS family aminotransferase [Streptomyces sp. NPDC006476]|uniref:DegT/DnrJ/EryC1/StrS family aminotransferase n=1 Tax=Streptomyces sp. NPDC006476 TaxID=3157175 RepID=UPI0033A7707E